MRAASQKRVLGTLARSRSAGPIALEPATRIDTRRRRRKARKRLQNALLELEERTHLPEVKVWRIQPVLEVCLYARHYAAWRRGRERAWKRDGPYWTTQRWPEKLPDGMIAGVLLPQSHSGRFRGAPAEILMPFIAVHAPLIVSDLEEPYDSLVLGLLTRWACTAANTRPIGDTMLLAPPLVDVIAPKPVDRVPRDLGLSWPLPVSEPHVRPARRF
jgi:hypothetical protein